jgi:hypothetical protein
MEHQMDLRLCDLMFIKDASMTTATDGGGKTSKQQTEGEVARILRLLEDLTAEIALTLPYQELITKHDDKILHALNEHTKNMRDSVLIQLESLTQSTASIAHHQNLVVKWGQIAPMIPSQPFVNRLFSDSLNDKLEVAKFVVQKFFVDRATKQMCFFQASAMAYHFFTVLDSFPHVPTHCLFHVNGPVALLPVLFGRSNGRHSLVPFWGSIFDTHCGACLPPSGDEAAFRALKDLFLRAHEPLHIAFLTPRYITPDGRVFYERLESVHFVDAIEESILQRPDTEIVVLATGDRLMRSTDEIPENHRQLVALQEILETQPQQLTYVLTSPKYPANTVAVTLKERAGKVFWQADNKWAQV